MLCELTPIGIDCSDTLQRIAEKIPDLDMILFDHREGDLIRSQQLLEDIQQLKTNSSGHLVLLYSIRIPLIT
jgi:hypothetical protein